MGTSYTYTYKRIVIWVILIGIIAFGFFFMRKISSGTETRKDLREANVNKNKAKSNLQLSKTLAVTVQNPKVEKIQDLIEVTGFLRVNQQVTLASKISERVAQILVEEGDRVKSGQLLIILDEAQIGAQVAQAEAALKGALARLEQTKANKKIQDVQTQTRLEQAQADLAAVQARLKQTETQEQLTSVSSDSSVIRAENDLQAAKTGLLQAEAQHISAKSDLENAKERFSRRQRLYDRGVISQEELAEAKRAVDMLQAQTTVAEHNVAAAQIRVRQAEVALTLAKSNLDQRLISQSEVQATQERAKQALSALRASEASQSQTVITAEDVKVAEAAVQQAEANLTYVRQQLKSARIVAPFNGIITKRMSNLGQVVSPITPLMELTSIDNVYLEAEVSENQIPYIHLGLPVHATVDSLPEVELEGKVSTIIPVAQEDNHMFRIRISLPKNSELKPGSFGRGRIMAREVSSALIVPKSAIVSKDGLDAVFVASKNRARLRHVSLGTTTPNGVEILKGIDKNDLVIVLGAQSLQDGMDIEIKE